MKQIKLYIFLKSQSPIKFYFIFNTLKNTFYSMKVKHNYKSLKTYT